MFTLTCKCPQCDRITSQCTDTSLQKDRVEYDGTRCRQCVRTTRANGLKKPTPHGGNTVDSTAIGTGRGMWPGKRKQAVMTTRFGPRGIR